MSVAVKCGVGGGTGGVVPVSSSQDCIVTKSIDNIVGNLWQARQESSGSSLGNQSPRNGEELSDHESSVRDHLTPPMDDQPLSLENHGKVTLKDTRDLLQEEPNIKLDGANSVDVSARASLIPGQEDHLIPPNFLASLPALEAHLQRQREFLGSAGVPQNFFSAAAAAAAAAGLRHSTAGFLPQLQTPFGAAGCVPQGLPLLPPPKPPTPSSQCGSPVQQCGSASGPQNWSFEEQFKQLYELDDNPKRKEFLDEMFALMQKRGTPINRLPIMAKQVLDLYELYNLVVARGGLVEVINKKLWQEIIKGLGLPSSITSAAFTLRTQYTKYLYPIECLKRNLSSPGELQIAIEGNKREGRRGSYGSCPDGLMPPGLMMPSHIPGMPHNPSTQMSPMSLISQRIPQFNGNNPLLLTKDATSPPSSLTGLGIPFSNHNGTTSPGQDSLSALEMTRLALWKMYNNSTVGAGMIADQLPRHPAPLLPPLPTNPNTGITEMFTANINEEKALNLEKSSSNTTKLINSFKESQSLVPVEEQSINVARNFSDVSAPNITCDNNANVENHCSNGVVTDADSDAEVNLISQVYKERQVEDEDEDEEEEDEDGRSSNDDDRLASSTSPPINILSFNAATSQHPHTVEKEQEANNIAQQLESSRKRKCLSPISSHRKAESIQLGNLPGANIKITSRGDSHNGDGSLVVSMEINGISYQGVLFAQQKYRRPSS